VRGAAALVLLWAACGGAGPPPRVDACLRYQQAVRDPLARMGRAADAFGEAVGRGPDQAVAASRDLAARLDEEKDALGRIQPERQDIAGVHGGLIAAVAGLADAMRFIGDVVARRDEAHRGDARSRLTQAEGRWQGAVDKVKTVCPEVALPP